MLVNPVFANSVQQAISSAFGCDSMVAEASAAKALFVKYSARTTIIDQDSADDRLFLVVEGHARLLAYAMDGRLMLVEDYWVGDLFGEGALAAEPLSADEITAVDDVSTVIFLAQVMVALMAAHSSVSLAISRMLIARLSAVTRRLVEGTTLSATGRIHAEILRRARGGEGMSIRPAPVHSELAFQVSSTRETVSRTINALLKRGIARRDGEALTIVAPHRLEELIF
jgi:CRP/FNR family transcriptional regulator, cyclic AMP receptor protein